MTDIENVFIKEEGEFRSDEVHDRRLTRLDSFQRDSRSVIVISAELALPQESNEMIIC